jgi:hypothetical protein
VVLLGVLALVLHGAVIVWVNQTPPPQLPVVPPEIPPMTIEFSQPAPPVVVPPPEPIPQPVVEPPPPVEDAVEGHLQGSGYQLQAQELGTGAHTKIGGRLRRFAY